MKILVDKHTITIQKNEIVNEGEYNVQSCDFEFTSDYDGLPKFAVFKTETVTTQVVLSGNSCITPEEVLQNTGIVGVGVYAYETDGTNINLRYSPTPAIFTVEPGSYDEGDSPTPPTPSIVEQLQAEITQNANNISSLQELTAAHTSQISDIQNDISDIKSEQITQNGNIQANTNDISDIKAEQITQNQNIQTNANNISTLQNNLSDEILNRQNADNNLQSQIDAITVSSDVVDVVGTYQDLQNYDTQHIKENDIIKVLQDSTHSNSMSYYRWVITDHVGTWKYVGSEGPYYTKSETDVLLQEKANSDDVYTKSEVYNKTETDNLLNGKQNTLTFDTTPTENSTNPVTSGGIYSSQAEQNTQINSLNNLVNQLPTVDETGTDLSLENTINYSFMKLDLSGNSVQDTEPTPSTPISIKTVTGENSLKLQNKNYFDIEIASSRVKNGYIISNIIGDNGASNKITYIDIEPNTTYTVTRYDNPTSSGTNFGIGSCDVIPANNVVLNSYETGNKDTHSLTVTSTSNDKYLAIYAKDGNNILIDSLLNKIQVEKGPISTPYVQYQAQIYPLSFGNMEFLKIPNTDYEDYIYKNGNNWYKKESIKKIVLNGDENWTYTNGIFYLASITNYKTTAENICLCTHYASQNCVTAIAQVDDKHITFRNDRETRRLYIKDSDFTSTSSLESWLSENNVTVYYALATPTDIQITDTTLITQLNNIYNNACSYSGTTNITSTYADGNAQMIIGASALMDLNTLVTRIETIESEV